MGYKVLYDDQILFDPYTNDIITDASITFKVNTAAYFDFTISSTHSLYNVIAERAGIVTVFFDDKKLYAGEISNIDEDFEGNKDITCSGVLDYLKDTIVRPYSTIEGEEKLTAPSSVDGYFQWLIDRHNENCLDARKQFVVGINQGNMLDANNYIYRASEQRPTTASEIENKILDSMGGYLFARFDGDQNILDLYADAHEANTQIIDFGVNITDFAKSISTDDQYTAVVATGYTPNPPENDPTRKMKPITLEGCIDGGTSYSPTMIKRGDVVYDVDAVARYGYKEYYVSNTDIKTYDGLLNYACRTLNTLISPALSITVKAIDLALYTNNGYEHLNIGQAVRVRSKPHNVDEYLMVNSIKLDLIEPGNTEYELGVSYDSLTGQQSSYLKTLNSSISKSLDTVAALGDDVKNAAQTATEAKSSADDASTKADKAQSAADSANTKADNAQSTADNANTKAEEAKTDAATANTKSDEAKETASKADTKSDEAKQAANDANVKSDEAKETATDAKAKAESASQTATDAKKTANDAALKAEDVEKLANQTNANLEAYKKSTDNTIEKINQSASDAKTAADKAQSTIDDYKTTADANISAAKAAADKAQKAADTVDASLGSFKAEAAEAISNANNAAKNAQNAADTAQSTINDYKTEADAKISEAQDAVNTVQSNLEKYETEANANISAAQKAADKAQSSANVAASAASKAQNDIDANVKATSAAQATADAAKSAAATAQAKADNVASNLDSANAVIEQHSTELGELSTKVSNAVKNADSALTTSTEAKQTATEASTKAETAYNDSQTAITNSTEAKQTATEASTKAESAVTTANDSLKRASSAVQTANKIQTTLTTEYQTKAASDELYATKSSLTETSESIKMEVEKTYATKTTVDALKNIADNAIESWTGTGAPTLENKPASDWTTDVLKKQHAGDLYYDKATGKAYRFGTEDGKTYSWTLNQDTDVTKALSDAAKAQKTADSATSKADAAQNSANTAQSTADTAKANATTAKTAADNAQTSANNAQSDVDKLKIDIPNTYATKASLETTAESITATVTKAQSTADSAVTAASKAQQTADSVSVNLSKNYQTKASADNVYATKASLKATSESISAEVSKAQATADGAVTSASKAQQTADAVKTDLSTNYLTSGQIDTTYATKASLEATSEAITTTVEKAQSTADSAVTAASKAQQTADSVSVNLSKNYQTKADADKIYATQASLNATSDSITSTVSKNYATKTELATTNSNVQGAQTTADTAKANASKAQQTADLKGIDYSQGKMLYTDPTFDNGNNHIYCYNNLDNNNVILTRILKNIDNPITNATYEYEIKTIGTATPGNGGFTFNTNTRANAVFIARIIAKIPTKHYFRFASNSIGNGGTSINITSTLGTGKYQEYVWKVTCGSDGIFYSTNYFWIEGPTATTDNPLIWYVAYATVFDMTDVGDALTANRDVQSLKTNVETNYATKSSLTQTSDSIKSEVSKTYATKTELSTTDANVSKAQQTADSVKSDLASNYSTTAAMASAINQKADSITSTVSKTYATKTAVEQLQNIADAAIETHFGENAPTTSNEPASKWNTNDLKKQHLGDLYYDKNSFVYRWVQNSDSSYSWKQLKDTEITKALEDAANAQKTADSATTKANAAQSSADAVKDNLARNYSTTASMNSAINQKADSITSTVSKTYATKTELSTTDANVSKAQSTADSATTKANAAQGSADKAQSAANAVKKDLGDNYSTTLQMNSAIEQKADSITQTVSQTYATKTQLTATDNKAGNALNAANAAQKDVDTIKTRVAATETSIKQNSDAISLRATKTEVSDAINDISIGGRNLCLNSATFERFGIARLNVGSILSGEAPDGSDAKVYKYDASGIPEGTNMWTEFTLPKRNSVVEDSYKEFKSFAGKTLILSFWIKTDSTSAVEKNAVLRIYDKNQIVVNYSFTNYTVKASDGWKKVVCKCDIPESAAMIDFSTQMPWYIFLYTARNKADYRVYFFKVKLEVGNKPTDWTPAPEDLENDATTKADNALTEAKLYSDAQLKVSSDSITSTVSKTYATKTELSNTDANVSKAQSTANSAATAASKAQSTADSATTKANAAQSTADTVKSNLANNYSTTTQMNSAINQKADSITQTVANTYQIKGDYATNTSVDSKIEQKANSIASTVEATYATKTTVDALKNIADAAIETWTGSGEPTLTNLPASKWNTDDLKKQHSGDLYYDSKTNYSYRFGSSDGKTYAWSLIKDTEITKALSDAAKAQESANTANGAVAKLRTDVVNTYATKTSLTQTANDITAKVTEAQSTADGAVTKATTAQQTADSVKLDISKNYSTTSVADAKYATQASLTATANDITTKVTKAQSTADGAVTAASKAQQTADSVSINLGKNYYTKSDSDKKINDISIGGRNLISNLSENWSNGSWDSNVSVGSPISIISYANRVSLKNPIEVSPGKQYWFKIHTNIICLGLFRELDSDKNFVTSVINLTDELWTCPNNVRYVALTIYDTGSLNAIQNGTIKVKLERGNKPTDWTPSPEDLATTTYTNAQIEASADSITSTVSKTYQTKGDYPTKTEMNSAIEQKANSITTTVSGTYATKTDLDKTNSNVRAAQTTADTAKTNASKAQSTANSATTAASKAQSTADAVKSDLTKNYSTTTDTITAIATSSDAIKKTLADDYLTGTQVESKISQSASSITTSLNAVKKTADDAYSATNTLNTTVTGIKNNLSQNYYTKSDVDKTTSGLVTNATYTQGLNGLKQTLSEDYYTKSDVDNTSTGYTKKSDFTAGINGINQTLSKNYYTKTDSDKLYKTQASFTADINGLKSDISKTYSTKTETANVNSTLTQKIDELSGSVTSINSSVESLTNIANAAIETHRGTGVPTLTNKPASDWTTDALKKQHAGDIYYDSNTNYSYRFGSSDGKTYSWELIKDSDITTAISKANAAQTTANSASSAASKAQTTANSAQTTANNASTAASKAQSTANSATTAASKAQSTADAVKSDLTKNYSTTTAMNSAISAKADSITQSVSKTYETKTDASAKLTSANSHSDANLAAAKADSTTKANTAETNAKNAANTALAAAKSEIKSTTDAIKLSVDNNFLSGTSLISDVAFKMGSANPDGWTSGILATGSLTLNNGHNAASKRLFRAKPGDTFYATMTCNTANLADGLNVCFGFVALLSDGITSKNWIYPLRFSKSSSTLTGSAYATIANTAANSGVTYVRPYILIDGTSKLGSAVVYYASLVNISGPVMQSNASINVQKNRIDTVVKDLSTTNTNLTNVTGRVSKVEQTTSEITTTITTIQGDVKTAKSTATTANNTANAASSTATGAVGRLNTMDTLIRQTSDGIEVAKKVNGSYTTSKTLIDDTGFSVLDKDGNLLSKFGSNKIELAKQSNVGEISFLNDVISLITETVTTSQNNVYTNGILQNNKKNGSITILTGTLNMNTSIGKKSLIRLQCNDDDNDSNILINSTNQSATYKSEITVNASDSKSFIKFYSKNLYFQYGSTTDTIAKMEMPYFIRMLKPHAWRFAETDSEKTYTPATTGWHTASSIFAIKKAGPDDYANFFTLSNGTLTFKVAGLWRIEFQMGASNDGRIGTGIWYDIYEEASAFTYPMYRAVSTVRAVLIKYFDVGKTITIKEFCEGNSMTKQLQSRLTHVDIEYLGNSNLY